MARLSRWSAEERERLLRMVDEGLISVDTFDEIARRSETVPDDVEPRQPPPPREPTVVDRVADHWPLVAGVVALVGALVVGVAVLASGGDDDEAAATIASADPADLSETAPTDPDADPDAEPEGEVAGVSGEAELADGSTESGADPHTERDLEQGIEDDIEYLAELSDSLELTMVEFREVIGELRRSTEIGVSHAALEEIAEDGGEIDCYRISLTWLAYGADRDEMRPVVEEYRERLRPTKTDLDRALAAEGSFGSAAVEELAESVADDYQDALLEMNEAVPFPTRFRDEIAPAARDECDAVIRF